MIISLYIVGLKKNMSFLIVTWTERESAIGLWQQITINPTNIFINLKLQCIFTIIKVPFFILNVPPYIFALIDYRSDNKLIKFYIIANKIKIMYTTSRKCTIDVKFTV